VSASLECPDRACWQALVRDALPPDQRERCERHLESCATCQNLLDQAEEGDDTLEELAQQVGDPTAVPAENALAALLDRLLDRQSPAEAPGLYFLQPTGLPDRLGKLGSYEVEAVIGRGGMGIVLRAFDPRLHRHVALKVLAPPLAASPTARRRFTREARAAAAVRHENIVAVHGVHEAQGLPYLVMHYVAGESLQARLHRTGPLELAEIVRIGYETASGLAAAHERGLMHRDIKPANILLEGDGARVKITDFGLARAVDEVGLTQQGVVAGTPEYMAPEQARGEAADHRADLFALGSVLYALAAGVPPFRGATTAAVLREVSEGQPTPLRSVNPKVPAWLETLIHRLLAREPAQRFGSAAEVAALLAGYLAHLRQPAASPAPRLPGPPVNRCPAQPSRARFAVGSRRRLWPAALVLVAILGLGARLIVFGLTQAGGPAAAPAGANDPAARPGPPDGAIDEHIRSLAFSPDGTRLATSGGDYRLPGQLQIWDVATGKAVVTRQGFPGARAVAYSPDGQVLATGHFAGDIVLRDPLTGKERATLTGHEVGTNGLAFSADGALLASAGLDTTVRLWDVKALRQRQVFLGHTGMVFGVAFFPHGRAFVTGGEDRTARVWDVDTGRERFVLRGHTQAIETVAISPGDQVVATGSRDGTIRFWDAATGKGVGVLRQERGSVQFVAFSPDGRLLASAGSDGTVHLWDVASRQQLHSLRQHGAIAWAVAFSPDGKLLASGGEDSIAKLWDVAAERDVAILSAVGAQPSPDVSGDITPPAGPRGWVAAAVLLGLFLTLGLAGGLYLRQRRRAVRITAPAGGPAEQGSPEADAPPVVVSCSACGKTLKARAALVGKRVKCPQCHQLVLVLRPESGQTGTTPS
jgi:hypothetical protein